jgi:hypothetical protein
MPPTEFNTEYEKLFGDCCRQRCDFSVQSSADKVNDRGQARDLFSQTLLFMLRTPVELSLLVTVLEKQPSNRHSCPHKRNK